LKRVVVDASVVLAGLFKDGTVRDVLLNAEDLSFSAPLYLREEVEKQLARVASRAGIPRETVESVLEDILGAIDLVPSGVYSASLDLARRLAKRAEAVGDADYIALCLALEAPVWTLDKDFDRVPGLRVLRTKDVDAAQVMRDQAASHIRR